MKAPKTSDLLFVLVIAALALVIVTMCSSCVQHAPAAVRTIPPEPIEFVAIAPGLRLYHLPKGTPCVVADTGNSNGVAISCDWSHPNGAIE